MGQHLSNPIAQLKASAQPGQRIVRTIKLDEFHSLVPNVMPQLAFNHDKREITIGIGVHVIKPSPIEGGQREAIVSVLTLGTVSYDELVARFTAQIAAQLAEPPDG